MNIRWKYVGVQNDVFLQLFMELPNKGALVSYPDFGDLFYRKCINFSSHYACPG